MSLNARQQAKNLIGLTIRGVEPKGLINNVIKEIRESAGPLHIGSHVKIMSPWTGKTYDDKPVSIGQGDIVSVIQSGLGENGNDFMILLSDGVTRVVVPSSLISEAVEEQDATKEGPDEFMDDSEPGSPTGLIPQSVQGDGDTPEDVEPSEKKGSSTPQGQVNSTNLGDAEPKDDPSAQTISGDQETQAAPAVEAVNKHLKALISECSGETKRRLTTFLEALKKTKNIGAYCEAYEMLFGKTESTLDDLCNLFEADAPPWVKDKEDDSSDDGEDDSSDDSSNDDSETNEGIEDLAMDDEDDDVDDIDMNADDADEKAVRRFFAKFAGKYQNAVGEPDDSDDDVPPMDDGGDDDVPPMDDGGDDVPPMDDEEDDVVPDDTYVGDDSSDLDDEDPMGIPPDDDEMSDDDEEPDMSCMKYRGKYSNRLGVARKMMATYGSRHR